MTHAYASFRYCLELLVSTAHRIRPTCSPCISLISSFNTALTSLCCLIVLNPLNSGDVMEMA